MGVWSLTDLSQLVRDPEDTGDENNPSYQGALILEDNEIFNSKQWGIVVKPTDQDYNNVGEANAASQTYEWHPGSPLLLDYPNSPTQAPGAVIMNNVIADSGQGGIDFEGAPTGVTGTNPVTGHAMPLPVAIVPFGRIVNNTLYGGPTAAGTGIYVANNAAPTLLNNVVVNFQTGINVDPTKGNNSNTVAGYTAYYGNGSDGTYGPANGEQGAIDLTASPFVAPAKYNFYPVRGSQIIDASLNSLTDRQNMLNVKNTVGINPSPILAPAYDLFGQLRISAPPGQGSSGAGLDAYIDIGAIDRVDFVGPTAALTNPLDNGPEDLNPANGAVGILGGAATTQFSVVLSDVGTGVDNTTVTSSAVQVFQDQNTEPMAEGQDYFFEYNATNHEIDLIPAPGIWATGHTYTIVLDGAGSTNPIEDLSGNPIQANQPNGTTEFTIDLANPVAIVPSSTLLPQDTVNVPYDQLITTTGGLGQVTLAVSNISTGTVTWLNNQNPFTVTGNTLTITGTPLTAGIETFTVTATDSLDASDTATTTYSITVNPAVSLSPATTTLPQDTVSIPYSQTITASGGTGAVTLTVSNISTGTVTWLNNQNPFTVTGNTLAITGTPLTAGTETFLVTATDSVDATASATYTIQVNPQVTLSPAPSNPLTVFVLPGATVGLTYSQTITASGGTPAVTWAVTNIKVNGAAGPGIPGLNFNPTGNILAIGGIPTAAGTETFTVTAADSVGDTASANYSIVVQAITLAPALLPADTVNIAYGPQTITASGGVAPVTLAVSNIQNAIPGLNVPLTSSSNTLTINGTPTLAGTETFTVTATDSKGNHQSANYSITVNPALSFSPALLTLPADTVNVAYSQTITANGGTPGVNVAVSNVQVNGVAGPGISGLTLIPTGNTLAIGGTPTFTGTTAETETFTVTATDSVDATTNATYSITVNPAITLSPATLPAGMQGATYSQTIAASGGTGTLTLTSKVTSSVPGLKVAPSGTGSLAITGTPAAAGTETFTVSATDSVGATAGPVTYSIIVSPPIVLSPTTLPGDVVNQAYNQTITASGGTGTLTLTSKVTSSVNGLRVPASGTGSLTITGTPTTTGTETFTLMVTDSNGATIGPITYSFIVSPPLTLSPTTLPADTQSVPYNATITASGGIGTTTLAVSNIQGAIPGLNVPPSGTGSLTITGTPTAAGTETFTVNANDTGGGLVSTYSITVNPAVSFSPATLPGATVSVAYFQTITSHGGTGTVTLAVSNIQNAIPGLSVPASGTGNLGITGTPTAAGTETFTLTGTDSLGAKTTATYSITATGTTTTTTAVAVASSANPSVYGQSVTFTATVTPASGTFDDGGTVQFLVDGASFGSPQSFNIAAGAFTIQDAALSVGTHTITANYSGDTKFPKGSGTLLNGETVSKATPVITWSTPAAIPYGTALSSTQLDATANVPGAFSYTPAAGTVLSGGNQTLSVTFTPTDTTDYTTATKTITINVTTAGLTVTWPKPAAITYGTPLSSANWTPRPACPARSVTRRPPGRCCRLATARRSPSPLLPPIRRITPRSRRRPRST